MGQAAARRNEELLGAMARVRARLSTASSGEGEFAEDNADVRLLTRRLERVCRRSGTFHAVSLSPYMESLLQLGR